jgi:transcriptional regulator with XRE-family HTH domain
MAQDFPEWFKATRERKKLTQLEVAQQLGLSSPTISRWETGTEPRAGHLGRLCLWAPIKPDKLLRLFGA